MIDLGLYITHLLEVQTPCSHRQLLLDLQQAGWRELSDLQMTQILNGLKEKGWVTSHHSEEGGFLHWLRTPEGSAALEKEQFGE